MTLENYNYRTSPLFLRNQFDSKTTGKFKIPVIPKAYFTDADFKDLLLIGFDRTKIDDTKYLDRMVHFFLYDYKFEQIWKDPDKSIQKLKKYKAVLSPDFSMYREMNPTMQLYNTFRNRWCGAYLANEGIRVIPTVSWGDENTFDFCFHGIPKGSTVAVSTYMVSEHGNHKDQKEFFLKGYNEMLRQVEPERVVCYNTPFPEMEGNIVFVDYELSSWKYQNKDYNAPKYYKHITGELLPIDKGDIIIKKGYVLSMCEEKGMGSAYGGEWEPKKPEDERFLGEPGEIKTTKIPGKRGGYTAITKIGEDGKATIERHLTDHEKPHKHTNPHDHKINWEFPKKNFPNFEKPHINYYENVPEFKTVKGVEKMNYDINEITYNFQTISEFKDCIIRGGEVCFEWKGKAYSIADDGNGVFSFGEGCYKKGNNYYNVASNTEYDISNEIICETADEVLEIVIDGDRLRDIITKVEVTERNL